MASKLLIVDGNERILDTLAGMFMEIGLDVATAATPADALRLVTEEKFRMVFVDNQFGSMESMELIEQLRTADANLQFVIMISDPDIEMAIHALKDGIADFLRKPFHFEDLLVCIEHVNRKIEIERQNKEFHERRKDGP
jgi:DNA-binding NtrC family response regulator